MSKVMNNELYLTVESESAEIVDSWWCAACAACAACLVGGAAAVAAAASLATL